LSDRYRTPPPPPRQNTDDGGDRRHTPRQPARYVRLVTARKQAGITQAELAERTGISQSRICTLETTTGETTTARNRARLAYALGVDPALLRFGPNPRVRAAIKRERRRHP